MPDLLNYGLYLDSREGVSVEELADDYELPIEEIEERLAAAKLCFELQIDHIEFADDF
ncbi:MAG TPA: hypothetical protein VFA28_06400 [Bryobacteraceae bacterium]|jgi:uncharacterized protein (DUF433 family)|nr:hypothetical protein [Bryobacteraceae bacterium]